MSSPGNNKEGKEYGYQDNRYIIDQYLIAPADRQNHKGYKASEWKAWVELFGVPLLDQRLDDSCVDNFRLLSCIYSLSKQLSLRRSEVDSLDDLVVRFVRSYEVSYLLSST